MRSPPTYDDFDRLRRHMLWRAGIIRTRQASPEVPDRCVKAPLREKDQLFLIVVFLCVLTELFLLLCLLGANRATSLP